MSAFTGSANGTKYIDSNTFWNNGGYRMGGTNGSASGVYFTNNKIYSGTMLSYGITMVQNYGNNTTSFAEPTLAIWSGGNVTPTPTPGPTFGLNRGNDFWNDTGSVLNAMRFQNTAVTGHLTKLELQYNTSASTGKVHLGVYSDNNGQPGNLLMDAGEVNVANGWVTISGLNLTVTQNSY
jgi:hypothetical protein